MKSFFTLLALSFFIFVLGVEVKAQAKTDSLRKGPAILNVDSSITAVPFMMNEDSNLVTPCNEFNMPVYKGKEGIDSKIVIAPIDKGFNYNMPVIGEDTTCWQDKNRAVD